MLKPNKLYVIKLARKQWTIGFVPESRKPVRQFTLLIDTYSTREAARKWIKAFQKVASLRGESI